MKASKAPVKCPQCFGRGKITVTHHGPDGSGEFDMDCLTCKGKKTVTAAEAEAHDVWCKCPGEPKAKYFPNGAHPLCWKHCWGCVACGKIIQIG